MTEQLTLSSDQRRSAEALLDIPLFPPGAAPELHEAEGREDIRAFAARIALDGIEQSCQDKQTLRRQIAIANSALRWASQTSASSPRERAQGKAEQALYSQLQTVPIHEGQTELDGLLTVAPTGTGKTVLAARLLHYAGIGTRPAPDENPLRALVVVPDQTLIQQYTGDIGDDTFRRFLGNDATISSYWQKEKDATGDITITTTLSLPRAIDQGAINPEDYDIGILDEAHRGLSPRMIERLGHIGRQLFCFTATPAYNELRDLRNIIPHIEIGNLCSFVEEGILSPVRLNTYQAKNDDEVFPIALGLAKHYLDQGRRVVAYCQRGEGSLQARMLEAAINSFYEDEPAKAIGSFNRGEATQALRDFDQGDVRLLATTSMLREGWNAKVDAAILIGPNRSQLDLTQKVGRAMRPGDMVTEISEILPQPKEGAPMMSIYSLFGLEEIQESLLIGNPWSGSPANQSSSFGELPPILQTSLVTSLPIRSVTIAPPDLQRMEPMPEGYVATSELLGDSSLPLKLLYKLLDRQGIPYTIQRSGKQQERWYAAEAADFIALNPLPELADEEERTRYATSVMAGVSEKFLKEIADRLGIVGTRKVTRGHHKSRVVYSADEVKVLLEEVENIPEADITDTTLGQLGQELGDYHYIYNYCVNSSSITPVRKRRNQAHGIMGICPHITADEAEIIRQAYNNRAILDTSTHISLVEMAELTGLRRHVVSRKLSEEEKALLQSFEQPGVGNGTAQALPRDVGLKIVERIKPKNEKIPPHLVSFTIISQRVTPGSAARWLKKEEVEPQIIDAGGRQGQLKCYPWQTLEALERAFKVKEDAIPIDFSRLPGVSSNPAQAEKYAQEIQRHYTPEELLEAPRWLDGPATAEKLSCSLYALNVLAGQARPGEGEIESTPTGAYLSPALLERIAAQPPRPTPPMGWVSHTHLSRTTGADDAAISQALKNIGTARRGLFRKHNFTDIWYDGITAQTIAVFLRSKTMRNKRS